MYSSATTGDDFFTPEACEYYEAISPAVNDDAGGRELMKSFSPDDCTNKRLNIIKRNLIALFDVVLRQCYTFSSLGIGGMDTRSCCSRWEKQQRGGKTSICKVSDGVCF